MTYLRKTQFGIITIAGSLILLLILLVGCTSPDPAAESEERPENAQIQYDSELIEFKDLEMFVPPNWDETRKESSVTLIGQEGK